MEASSSGSGSKILSFSRDQKQYSPLIEDSSTSSSVQIPNLRYEGMNFQHRKKTYDQFQLPQINSNHVNASLVKPSKQAVSPGCQTDMTAFQSFKQNQILQLQKYQEKRQVAFYSGSLNDPKSHSPQRYLQAEQSSPKTQSGITVQALPLRENSLGQSLDTSLVKASQSSFELIKKATSKLFPQEKKGYIYSKGGGQSSQNSVIKAKKKQAIALFRHPQISELVNSLKIAQERSPTNMQTTTGDTDDTTGGASSVQQLSFNDGISRVIGTQQIEQRLHSKEKSKLERKKINDLNQKFKSKSQSADLSSMLITGVDLGASIKSRQEEQEDLQGGELDQKQPVLVLQVIPKSKVSSSSVLTPVKGINCFPNFVEVQHKTIQSLEAETSLINLRATEIMELLKKNQENYEEFKSIPVRRVKPKKFYSVHQMPERICQKQEKRGNNPANRLELAEDSTQITQRETQTLSSEFTINSEGIQEKDVFSSSNQLIQIIHNQETAITEIQKRKVSGNIKNNSNSKKSPLQGENISKNSSMSAILPSGVKASQSIKDAPRKAQEINTDLTQNNNSNSINSISQAEIDITDKSNTQTIDSKNPCLMPEGVKLSPKTSSNCLAAKAYNLQQKILQKVPVEKHKTQEGERKGGSNEQSYLPVNPKIENDLNLKDISQGKQQQRSQDHFDSLNRLIVTPLKPWKLPKKANPQIENNNNKSTKTSSSQKKKMIALRDSRHIKNTDISGFDLNRTTQFGGFSIVDYCSMQDFNS